MFQIREMVIEDKEDVMTMAGDFYNSEAVDHEVHKDVLMRTFLDAAGPEPSIRGVILMDDACVAGFAYLTSFYACEAGGKNIMIEEVYLKENYRGRGFGSLFFKWLFQEYPDAVRFRLEVTGANKGASALYKKIGFKPLRYEQMILDIC